MENNNRLGPLEIIPPLVAVGATVLWIAIDGFTGESIAQALTSLCTMFVILIPIYKHIMKKPRETHFDTGLRALTEVRKKYPLFLAGPKYRKDDYAPDAQHSDHQYLYIQLPDSRRKSSFVAVSPFRRAIFEMGLSRTSLELLKIQRDFPEVKKQLHDALLEHAHRNYDHLFIEKNVDKYENICIVLDFDIERVSTKMFREIINDLTNFAISSLLKMKS
jgi:hypothetical protein